MSLCNKFTILIVHSYCLEKGGILLFFTSIYEWLLWSLTVNGLLVFHFVLLELRGKFLNACYWQNLIQWIFLVSTLTLLNVCVCVFCLQILVSMHCLPKKNWAQCFHTILVHMRFLQKQMPSYKIPW